MARARAWLRVSGCKRDGGGGHIPRRRQGHKDVGDRHEGHEGRRYCFEAGCQRVTVLAKWSRAVIGRMERELKEAYTLKNNKVDPSMWELNGPGLETPIVSDDRKLLILMKQDYNWAFNQGYKAKSEEK